jgi:hypothetical protein
MANLLVTAEIRTSNQRRDIALARNTELRGAGGLRAVFRNHDTSTSNFSDKLKTVFEQ